MIIKLPIPENIHLLIKKDEEVDFKTPLFEDVSFEKTKINISEKLKIKPEKIFHYLKKFVGEKIKKNEVIAEKKGLFFDKKIISPTDGIIEEINHHDGTVIIKIKSDKKSLYFSPIKGKIVSIAKDFLEIKVKKGEFFLLKEKSKKTLGGEFFYFESSLFFKTKSENVENKIIIAEKLSSFEQTKFEALGSVGFLTIESLPQKTELISLRLKNIEDLNKIKNNNFLYFLVLKNFDKIYLYI